MQDPLGMRVAHWIESVDSSVIGQGSRIQLPAGAKLQMLGPIFDNGGYDVEIVYDYSPGRAKKVTGGFELARDCPSPAARDPVLRGAHDPAWRRPIPDIR